MDCKVVYFLAYHPGNFLQIDLSLLIPFTCSLMVKEKENPSKSKRASIHGEHELILFNDDFNTFEFVIETLVDVCGHDFIQAEQCALVAHFNGKCTVKSGTYSDLKPLKDEMTQRELTVTIS
jgi:ATP-dependent Clp protease adaptor protein ClpS